MVLRALVSTALVLVCSALVEEEGRRNLFSQVYSILEEKHEKHSIHNLGPAAGVHREIARQHIPSSRHLPVATAAASSAAKAAGPKRRSLPDAFHYALPQILKRLKELEKIAGKSGPGPGP